MSHGRDTAPKPYGTVAGFATADELLAATQAVVNAGYKKLDAYSPVPVHGLADVMNFKDFRLHYGALAGGLTGATVGMSLQAITGGALTRIGIELPPMWNYAHNTGGKPLFSWPMFIPVMFECTILLTAFAVVGGLFALCGLPKPHHPIFNAEAFHRASQDRYFLCVEATDPRYAPDQVASLMHEMGAESVEHVMTSEGY